MVAPAEAVKPSTAPKTAPAVIAKGLPIVIFSPNVVEDDGRGSDRALYQVRRSTGTQASVFIFGLTNGTGPSTAPQAERWCGCLSFALEKHTAPLLKLKISGAVLAALQIAAV
jgi:hypothetical protein